MNIVVGKLGKKFYMRKKAWVIDSGDSEVATSLIVLAKKHPEMHFYVIGISDLDTFTPEEMIDYFPNENVTYIWKYYQKAKHEPRWEYPLQYFKEHDISIDFGWIHAGPTGAVNIPERTYIVKDIEKKVFAKTITMALMYAGPVIDFLNQSGIPYVMVGEDPRYYPCRARDLYNRPLMYLNTYNDFLYAKHALGYCTTELNMNKERLIDAKYDRWFLASEKMPDRSDIKRDILLDVYTNGRESSGTKKLKIIKEYLTSFSDMVIYGKWSEKLIEESPEFTFKNVPMIDLVEEMYRTKYTLMFHFKEGYPSSKFWKMIYFGIIPFYHYKMDTQKNQPVHEFCRVRSAEELKTKIAELEADPTKFKEIQDYHYDLFTETYMNGELIDDIFIHLINSKTELKAATNNDSDYKRVSVLNHDLSNLNKSDGGTDVFDILDSL